MPRSLDTGPSTPFGSGHINTTLLAERETASGVVRFEPCHHHATVGPMAGVTSASMQVYVVENTTHGNRAFSNLNEGRGKVLRMGAYSPEVIEKLRWMESTLGPTIKAALEAIENQKPEPEIASLLSIVTDAALATALTAAEPGALPRPDGSAASRLAIWLPAWVQLPV